MSCICGENNPDKNHLFSRNHYEKYAKVLSRDLSLTENVNGVTRMSFFFSHENKRSINIRAILMSIESVSVKLMAHITESLGAMDFKIVLVTQYMLEEKIETVYYHSDNVKIFANSNFSESVLDRYEELEHDLESKSWEASGWSLLKVLGVNFHYASYRPLKFGCREFAPVPDFLKNKNCVISMKGMKSRCFLYCILADKYGPADPINRHYFPSFYDKYMSEFNIEQLTFPISLDQVLTFCENNKEYCFNIFAYDDQTKKINLEFQTKKRNKKAKRVHLLILEAVDGILHFGLIKSLSRLLSTQHSAHNGKLSFCEDCLCAFKNQSLLDNHKRVCENVELSFPDKKDGVLEFKHHSHTIPVAAIFYMDLETMLIPRNDRSDNNNIEYKSKHEICGYAYLIKTRGFAENDEYFKDMRICFNPNPNNVLGLKFLSRLRRDVIDFYDRHLDPKNDKEIIMNEGDIERFNATTKCEFCDAKFTHYSEDLPVGSQEENETIILKNKHHWHCGMTNKPGEQPSNYLNALCSACNLAAEQPRFVVATSHNLSFDIAIVMKHLADVMHLFNDNVTICARSNSRYISLKWMINLDGKKHIECRLIDSLKFNPCSLKKLAETLELDDMVDLKEYFPEKYEDLAFKQTMCYNFFSCPDKFKETEFPSIEEFKDDLRGGEICSQSDYLHALSIFNHFKKEKEKEGTVELFTMQDYYEIYLKVDVLLLTAIMEKNRSIIFESFYIDPIHYVTLPSMSFDIMLRYTKVKLEYIHNADIYSYIRRSIRGGITGVNMREIVPNHDGMGELWDKSKPLVDLTYFDVNSSYASALSGMLPVGGFKYIEITTEEDEKKIYKECESLSSSSSYSYFMEIDVEFDEYLHPYLSDFPPLAQHSKVPDSKHEKLVNTLFNKEKYVTTVEMFQFLIFLKVKITKIHSVVRFNQSEFIKPYIKVNIDKRNDAKRRKNKVESNQYKLLNNAIFGRSIMRQDYRDIRLTHQFNYSGNDRNNEGQIIQNENLIRKNLKSKNKQYRSTKYKNCAQWYYAHPSYRDSVPISDTAVLIELAQINRKITVPIAVGSIVLERSKIYLLNFIYKFLKPSIDKYNIFNRCKCTAVPCYHDTDSFFVCTTGVRFYELMKGFEDEFFDTTTIPDEILQRFGLKKVNGGRLGVYSDECEGKSIKIGIFLAPKQYIYELIIDEKNENYKVVAKSAGTNQYNINKYMLHDYKRSLEKYKQNNFTLDDNDFNEEGRILINKKCEVNTIVMKKKKLNNLINKRWSHKTNWNLTLPFGDKRILEVYNEDYRYDAEKNEIYKFERKS